MVQREYASPIPSAIKLPAKALTIILFLEFLRGNAKTDECEPLFAQYRECLGVRATRSPLLFFTCRVFEK